MIKTCLYPIPVGGLLANEIRYLLRNMDWLEEELGGFDDEYLIIDCPGRLNFSSCIISANLNCIKVR